LREVQLEIPWRSPLSTELNDASTGRIGVPVVCFVMTLQHLCIATIARVVLSRTKRVKPLLGGYITRPLFYIGSLVLRGLGHYPKRPSLPLVKNWASGN